MSEAIDRSMPARLELVQQRDAAPARRAAGGAVLQVHVAHRQADDGDAGLGDGAERRLDEVLRLDGERAAMAALQAALEADAAPPSARSRSGPWRPDRRFRRHAGRGRARDRSASRKKRSSISRNCGGKASWTPPSKRVTAPRMPPASATMSASCSPCGSAKESMAMMLVGLDIDAAGPGVAQRREAPARRSRPAAPANRGACAWRPCPAPRRSCRPNSMRALHVLRRPARGAVGSRWRSRRPGSCRPGWASAARYGPCRDGCGCRRSPARPGRPRGRWRRRGAVPSGAMLAMRPSLTSMSKRTSPSKSGLPSGPLPTRQAWARASASQ